MLLRVASPAAFACEVFVPPGTTVAELKNILWIEHGFHPTRPLIFTSPDHRWSDSDPITEADSSSLFVFYDESEYPEKSYPSVDAAFSFPDSRFGRPPPPPGLDPFNLEGQIFPRAELALRLMSHPHLSDSDETGDESEPLDLTVQVVVSDAEEEEEEEHPWVRQPIGHDFLEVSAAEAPIIHRLQRLAPGIDRATIIQIFAICNRNEEQAQECLMSMD
jgi:hypothetical protein